MLELKSIQKSFDGTPVLKDISMQVNDGEIVSILGPSGCGKTTLLNLILGIVKADSGQILYNGEDLTEVSMEKRGFNIVFQDYALFPNLLFGGCRSCFGCHGYCICDGLRHSLHEHASMA